MRMSWLLCVLLVAPVWGQAAPGAPPAGQAPAAPGGMLARPPQASAPAEDKSASVPATAAVITVKGVCAPQAKPAAAKGTEAKSASAKTSAADCKTVITKAEFEKLATGVAPAVTPQLKKQLENALPRIIAMSGEAKKRGLDKTPQYEETVKFMKMQLLSQQLQRKIQEDAANISPADIEEYYKNHPEMFEQYNLDRIFVPRAKQVEPDAKEKDDDEKEAKLTDEERKAKQDAEKAKSDAAEQDMTKLADSLRARAASGEDFLKLQKEAFDAAGMKIESPTVNLPSVRRSALPPAHASAFDLKPGEVSQVMSDTGGHYIYKLNSKNEAPLDDKTKNEIHSTLQSQRTREAMDKVNGSFKVETNEAYFGPGGAGPMPPSRGPNPRMMPPNAPAPSAPPQAQTAPGAAPAAKPN